MTARKLSRRTFIRLALLGGIGAGFAYLQHQTAGLGLGNFIRWSLRGQLRNISRPAIVGLGKCTSYETDLKTILRKLWEISSMPDLAGKSVLVKPNLLDFVDSNLATTNPKLVGGILDLLTDLGVNHLVVGDGSAFRRDTTSVVKISGLDQELDARSIPFIDLNYAELVPVRPRDGWIRNTDELWLPRPAIEVDYILSVPKLKTHHWAGVTLGLKNLLGIIPGSRYGWPKNIIHMVGINPTILGLYQTLPPVLSIADGIIGMEGNGPLDGTPVEHGLLAIGKDALAVDIICARLMGFSIETIPHLSGAAWTGIGQGKRIETRGVSPQELQQHYQPPPVI